MQGKGERKEEKGKERKKKADIPFLSLRHIYLFTEKVALNMPKKKNPKK